MAKEKEIVKAIRLTWESLASHLPDAEKPLPKNLRKHTGIIGGQRFHKQCVREYAEVIRTLANVL